MRKKYSVVAVIEFILFFVIWSVIFRLGADPLLPSGFWKILLLIVILDCFEFIYFLILLAPRIAHKKQSFILNELLFTVVSMLVALSVSGLDNWFQDGKYVWFLVVTFVGLIYGTVFWLGNYLILRYLDDKF